jgi:hypothetical protein
VPWAAVSAAATGEPPRDTVVAIGLQQEETAAAVAAAVATAVASVATAVASASPALVSTAGDCAVVVDVADGDAPPPGGANGETGSRQPPSLRRRCW